MTCKLILFDKQITFLQAEWTQNIVQLDDIQEIMQ